MQGALFQMRDHYLNLLCGISLPHGYQVAQFGRRIIRIIDETRFGLNSPNERAERRVYRSFGLTVVLRSDLPPGGKSVSASVSHSLRVAQPPCRAASVSHSLHVILST